MAYRSHSAKMKGALRAAARSWTPFAPITITDQMKRDNPALVHCSFMFANSIYQVECFNCASSIGGVVQLVIRRHYGDDPIAWDALCRVLHELYGPNAVAAELYPPMDSAWAIKREVRVLWVFPQDYVAPFGLHIPTAWGRTGDA